MAEKLATCIHPRVYKGFSMAASENEINNNLVECVGMRCISRECMLGDSAGSNPMLCLNKTTNESN